MPRYGNIDQAFLGHCSESQGYMKVSTYGAGEDIDFGDPVFLTPEDPTRVYKRTTDIANIRFDTTPAIPTTGQIRISVTANNITNTLDVDAGATATLTLSAIITGLRTLNYDNFVPFGAKAGTVAATDIRIRVQGESFTTTSSSDEAITGLQFFPVASGVVGTAIDYEVEAVASSQIFAGVAKFIQRDSFATTEGSGYRKGDFISIVERGRIYAKVLSDSANNPIANVPAHVDLANGIFTSAATSGTIKDVGAFFRSQLFNLQYFTGLAQNTSVSDNMALIEVDGIRAIGDTIEEFYDF